MENISDFRLDPIDFHDAGQFSELQSQRRLCGWDYDTEILKTWASKQEARIKNMFWITANNTSDSDEQGTDNKPVRVGHISLDVAAPSFTPPELQNLPRVEKQVLSLSTFFILPKHRSSGLGRRVVQRLEEMAVQEPYGSANCRFIALNALSKRHMYDEGWEWKEIWARMGEEPPKFSIQEWYEKLGYVSWKEEQLHQQEGVVNGDIVLLWEAFMRKEISK